MIFRSVFSMWLKCEQTSDVQYVVLLDMIIFDIVWYYCNLHVVSCILVNVSSFVA